MWTGHGSCSNSSSTTARVPARLAASSLYDMTRAIPAPATAASTAASEVFTVNLDRIDATISRLLLVNFHARGVATSSVVIQSTSRRLDGFLRMTVRGKIGGARERYEPSRCGLPSCYYPEAC